MRYYDGPFVGLRQQEARPRAAVSPSPMAWASAPGFGLVSVGSATAIWLRRRGDAATRRKKMRPCPARATCTAPPRELATPARRAGGGHLLPSPPPRPRDISSSPYPPSPYPGPVSAWPRGAQPRRRPPGNSHSETRRREPGGGARGGRGGRGRRAGGVPPPGGQGRRAEGGGFPPGAGGEGRGGAPRRGWRRGTARERWQGRWRGRRAQR